MSVNIPSMLESEDVDVLYAASNFSRSVKALLVVEGPGEDVRDIAGELTVPSVSSVQACLRHGAIVGKE